MTATQAIRITRWQQVVIHLRAVVVGIVVAPIHFYRRVLSPLKTTPSCRYLPTCSEYALDAIEQRGVCVGVGLALGRILRCNPLFHGGYHPVTPRRRASACSHDHEAG
jgi:uncharacterized protein